MTDMKWSQGIEDWRPGRSWEDPKSPAVYWNLRTIRLRGSSSETIKN